MLKRDFHYELPEALIAQAPLSKRTDSRLLCINTREDSIQDGQFACFPDLLKQGDILVVNNTAVVPARLFGRKASGGWIEVLVDRVLEDGQVRALVRSSKSPRIGSLLILDGGIKAEIVAISDGVYTLALSDTRPALEILNAYGHIPLPPYIKRDDNKQDHERYQTVYASSPGASAAPTAGLHFDDEILGHIRGKGVVVADITLHVGHGTFQPVRAEQIQDHVMHHERVRVSQETCAQILKAREQGGRVVAVGTTVVRALEAAAQTGELNAYHGETNLFIYPGYRFQVVDALLTNFHLPKSSLLMLVCAFGGYERVMRAYRHAVGKGYRFFSYGDAMWLA